MKVKNEFTLKLSPRELAILLDLVASGMADDELPEEALIFGDSFLASFGVEVDDEPVTTEALH